MTKIGDQSGITAACNRLRDMDPGGTLLKKTSGGKWPDLSTLPENVDQWKAYDKLQRTLQILAEDHDAVATEDDYRPESAQARIFLAQAPLDALDGPSFMIPVCTADLGYREWYTPDTINRLREHFGTVEAWCDCRIPSGYVEGLGTGYDVAMDMVESFNLDGPAWGQCETFVEFDNGYLAGARRFIGQLADLRQDQIDRFASKEVLLAFELYRNKMPWQVPDYGIAGAGVGGNAIGVYASDTEGAVYTPVADYRNLGYYAPGTDSVYGVGLYPQDWRDLG